MSVATIENELGTMTNTERRAVIGFAAKLLAGDAKDKSRLSVEEKRAKLKVSAEMMFAEYSSNDNLVELTVLDSEGFLNA